jgi:hypothetical protein
MALISDTSDKGFKRFIPEATQEAIEDGPSTFDVVQSSFETENTFVNWAANGFSMGDDYAPVKDYNPFDSDIKGYELYSDSFIESRSPEQTMAIKQQVDLEIERRDVVANGGATGFVSSIAAGVTDPIYFPLMLVGLGEVKVANNIRQAAFRSAGLGAVSEIPAEIVKHQLQETRTLEESAINVGGSAILSGILGAGIHKLSRNAPEANVNPDELIRETEKLLTDEPVQLSVGAAQVKMLSKEDLDLSGLGGLEKIPVSPLVRTATSPELKTQQVSQQLLETPLVSKGNIEGIATAPEGGAVETRIKRWDANLYQSLVGLKDNYTAYKKSNTGKNLPLRDFRIQVGKAMRRNDEHSIPEVAAAAKHVRKVLIDPLKDEAIAGGQLPRDVEVSTAASYLTRIYNFDKINALRPEWNNIVDDWLVGIRGQAQQKLGVREAAPERIDLAKQDFGDAKVKERVKIKDTDQVTDVDVPAKEFWSRTTKQRRAIERIRNCLNA